MANADDPSTKLLAKALAAISTDAAPDDSNIIVNLTTGETINKNHTEKSA